MNKVKKSITPYRLASLLRNEPDPKLALQLFQNPSQNEPKKPFRHSSLSYDLIISKLGRAKLFSHMESVLTDMKQQQARFTPKEIIFCNVITFYGRSRMPDSARRAFESIPEFSTRRTIKSVNSLLNAYLNCREFEKMHNLFRDLHNHTDLVPDACTYNILIRASCLKGSLDNAWRIFDEMRVKRIEPSVVTFGTLISALCADMRLDEAFMVKDFMFRTFNLKPNVFIYTSLIKGVCKVNNDIDMAFELKQEMLDMGMELDAGVYSTLIGGLFKAGRGKGEVDRVLEEMRLRGIKADLVIYNTVISGFCLGKDFEGAFRVMDEMVEKGLKPDVFSYNIIVAGLCKAGRWREGVEMFEDMPRRGCFPDVVTYRTIFDGLCNSGEFKEAAFILDEMVFKGYFPRIVNLHKFIDGLCREGDWMLIESVLGSMAKGSIIDLSTWEAVVPLVCEKSLLMKSCDFVNALVNL